MELDGTALTGQRDWPDGSSRSSPRSGQDERAAAVTALFAQHALGLIRLAHIMLGNPAVAEDIVQDAFCGLYRRWPHLRDQSRAVGYVRSSVLNGCRSALRLHPTVELQEAHQPPAGSAESALLTAEERGEVLRALRRLPSRQREVLTLRFYLDLPDDQIAAAMGIGRGTVRSAAHRGLAALRQALKETP
jgi:RNA polymerase sigma-70 factor (sigma-E family)